MATKIIHKRSSVANKTPQAADLSPGELAINTADGKIFIKDDLDNVIDTTKQISERDSSVAVNDDGTTSDITATIDGDKKLEINAAGTTFTGPVAVDSAETVTFKDSANNNYVAFQAPDNVDFSYLVKLPASQPIDFSVLGNDGNGNATWSRSDIFGGNRIYVSDQYGDDANDGVNLPVRSLKRACQLAASLGQKPAVDPGQSYYNAKRLLEDNRTYIQREVVAYINTTYPALVYDEAKCERDVGLILDAVIFDIILGGNSKSVEAGESYAGVTEVQNNQKAETIDGIEYARDLAVDVINNRLPAVNYQNLIDQITYPSLDASAAETDVINRFDIVIGILDTGTSPAVIPADFRTIPITVSVSAGDFYIDNPIIVPDNVSIVGDGIRSVVVRPLNANKDMFRVRNGAYMFGITFRDGLDASRVPNYTFDWAVAFDDPTDTSVDRTGYFGISNEKPVITLSPYVQNCSIISFLGGNGIWVDGSKVVTPNVPTNDIEAENPVDLSDGIPEQGKSMVANAFTMISFGGTGWLVSNDGYAQIVSCFQIFCLNGSYTQSGGYLSITNSATNFGLYALRSSGYSQNSFTFDRGVIASTGTDNGVATYTSIGTNRVPVEQFVLRIKDQTTNADITQSFKQTTLELTFDAATDIDVATDIFTIVDHGLATGDAVYYTNEGNTDILGLLNNVLYYVNVIDTDTFRLFNDDSLSFAVDIQQLGSGTHKLTANVEEFFVERILDSHDDYQELTLPAGSYSFQPGQAIKGDTGGFENNAFVYEYDDVNNKLIVSNEFSIIEGNPQKILFTSSSTITEVGGSPASISVVDSGTILDTYFTATFRVVSTEEGNTIQSPANGLGQKINFHRPSIINSSAHTWEYAGSGTDYNALPQNGGKGRGTEFEQYSQLPGRVYSSGTNELGDFKVGDFIVAENKSGNITFRTQVSVGELTILRLSLSDVEINSISTDSGLGDNEPGGPQHSRLSTQRAIRTFIANRLGNVLDKDASTSAVPGALVQLNAQGQINQDLLPPARGVTTYNVDGFGERLNLANQIPPIEVISGDNASESYPQITLELTGTVTVVEGETITQASSGASGIVKEDITSEAAIRLIEPFVGTFDTTGELTGSTSGALGANSVPVTVGTETTIVDNYFLRTDTDSQYLILRSNQVYDFTGITTVTGANSGAQGDITNGPIYGIASGLDATTLVGGSNYLPASGSQTYQDVSLTGGSGTGAIADITVSNGEVSAVELKVGGTGYVAGDTLSASAGDLGGSGSGFSIDILKADTRLFVDLTGNFIKFAATTTSPEYIEDSTTTAISIADLEAFDDFSFNAQDLSLGGDVDYSNSIITITNHGLIDGDAVIYSNGGNIVIGNLINQKTYWIKVIDQDRIELYNNYAFTSGSKVLFGASSSGTHSFRRNTVGTTNNTFYVPAHGLSTGEVVRFSAGDPPGGIEDNGYYYIGSVTTNGFTFHTNKSDALASVNGVTASAIALSATGTGSATITIQNVEIIGTVNTSSTKEANWGKIAQATFDAGNIVSGVLSPSRLAEAGSATDKTFLRGDSQWSFAVQNMRPSSGSPINIVGDFFTETVDKYYNELEIDIARADEGNANPNFTSEGVAAFNKTQFTVDTGQVTVNSGVIDAGTLNGQPGNYYTNPLNLVGTIPVVKGGTGLTTYSQGDLIYSGSNNSLTQLNIGLANTVLTSDGSIPSWSSSLTLGGTLTVSGVTSVNDSTASTSTTTGAFKVSGGVGVQGDVYAGSIQDTPIGSTTANSASFTTLDASENVTFDGADAIIEMSPTGAASRVNLQPAGQLNLGKSGVGTNIIGNTVIGNGIGSVNITPNALSITPVSPGNMDGVDIGSTTPRSGTFSSLTSNGTLTVSGNATLSSDLGVTGDITAGGIQDTPIGLTTANSAAFTTVDASGQVDITNSTPSTAKTNGALHVTGGVGVEGTINTNAVVTDSFEATNGVTLSNGTNIDQLTTINVSMTLNESWQDTGINGTDLATGSYYMQIYANDVGVGGGHTDVYYSGIISWYAGTTSETTYDEIVLNRAGSSVSDGILFVRLLRTLSNPDNLKLQLAGNTINTGAATYTFKFRRLI